LLRQRNEYRVHLAVRPAALAFTLTIQALAEDFEKHGPETIERVRVQNPAAYLKVVASLLPKDVNLNVNNLDSLTDEQLLERLRVLTKEAAPLLARVAEDGEERRQAGALRH
jgi:hypothetical protein